MLSRSRINTLVAEAAALLDIPAVVVATTPGGHDTHYVEVILTVTDCDADTSCRLVVGLDRDKTDEELRGAIAASLRNHPDLHR
jgi:hypothetical protein